MNTFPGDHYRASSEKHGNRMIELTAQLEVYHWAESIGVSIIRKMAPSMGGKNWFATVDTPKHLRAEGATVREAIQNLKSKIANEA